MAFNNSIELHFSRVDIGPAKSTVTVLVYHMTDGGIVNGIQQYNRVLVNIPQRTQPLTFTLDAGLDVPRILAWGKKKLSDINVQIAGGYALADQICTLS